MLGLIGKKVGMTRAFDQDENLVPVTVVEAGPCPVVQVKTPQRDGYGAIKVGFGEGKASRLSRPVAGEYRKAGASSCRTMREFRVETTDHKVGDLLDVGIFQAGELIDVVGRSRGRGYAGGVKRHGFGGGPKTHGQSDRHRAPGSIGSSSDPSRVFKGVRMAGHMGDARITVRNVSVFGVDTGRNLLLLRGAVPGSRGATVVLCKKG